MPLTYIKGNIITSDATYIVHQANLVTNRALGLARDIFDAFPHADIYTDRSSHHNTLGHIVVRGNVDANTNNRQVIAMMAQRYPGIPKFSSDSANLRQKWFAECLKEIEELLGVDDSVAFPYKIGCGYGGGNWSEYEAMIVKFSVGKKVIIYTL